MVMSQKPEPTRVAGKDLYTPGLTCRLRYGRAVGVQQYWSRADTE